MKKTPQHRNWISRMRPTAASAVLALAAMLVSAAITTQLAQAQTFTTLHSFDGAGRHRAPSADGPGHRWELLRDNCGGRDRQLRHSLQNHL